MLAAEGLKDIIDMEQYPVGHYLNASQGGPFTYCRHGGWYECDMHAHYLCAKKIRSDDPWAMFDFVECANEQFGAVTEPANFPDPTVVRPLETCANKLKYNWTELSTCAKRDSPPLAIAAAKKGHERGIAFAPTVFVAGTEVSTMQGVDAKKVLAAICKAYTGKKPAGCKSVVEEKALSSTELQDSTCKIA